MPLYKGPIVRRDTSLGVHVRALWEGLTAILEHVPNVPSDKRVRLRNVRAALERAYPAELVTDSDIAQALAEEDGDALQEEP